MKQSAMGLKVLSKVFLEVPIEQKVKIAETFKNIYEAADTTLINFGTQRPRIKGHEDELIDGQRYQDICKNNEMLLVSFLSEVACQLPETKPLMPHRAYAQLDSLPEGEKNMQKNLYDVREKLFVNNFSNSLHALAANRNAQHPELTEHALSVLVESSKQKTKPLLNIFSGISINQLLTEQASIAKNETKVLDKQDQNAIRILQDLSTYPLTEEHTNELIDKLGAIIGSSSRATPEIKKIALNTLKEMAIKKPDFMENVIECLVNSPENKMTGEELRNAFIVSLISKDNSSNT